MAKGAFRLTAKGKRRPLSFDDVREIGRTLPGTVEGTTYGSPALKIHDEMFACIAINRSAEANTLAIRVEDSVRDTLIEAAPDIYYVTDHYIDYSIVLVRLGRIDRHALEALLREAHQRAITRKARPRTSAAVRTRAAARKRTPRRPA